VPIRTAVRHRGSRSSIRDQGAPIILEEHHGGGGKMQPHHVQLMSAMASAVIQSITVEGRNLP